MSEFDLEHFPTSPSAIKMMSRISPIYVHSYVGKWIFEVMGVEIDGARLRFEELRLQAFPETATWGIRYWEQKYGIPVNESLDLETRRKNVIIKRGIRSPMNPARIEQILGDMCGRQVEVTENVAPYAFQVTVYAGDTTVDFGAIFQRLRRIKPSHQRAVLIFEADTGIRIRPEQEAHRFPYILAGTVPQPNTVGGIGGEQIRPTFTAAGYPFDYSMTGQHRAGTLPQENTVGALEGVKIRPEIIAHGTSFSYPLTGLEQVGVLPQTNTAGGYNATTIKETVEEAGTIFPYTLAGTAPEINTEGGSAATQITQMIEGSGAVFLYPVSGTRPETNISGGNGGDGIYTEIETATSKFSYPLCGADND